MSTIHSINQLAPGARKAVARASSVVSITSLPFSSKTENNSEERNQLNLGQEASQAIPVSDTENITEENSSSSLPSSQ
jgi:hypothetical protein